jgi:hypothetical protein
VFAEGELKKIGDDLIRKRFQELAPLQRLAVFHDRPFLCPHDAYGETPVPLTPEELKKVMVHLKVTDILSLRDWQMDKLELIDFWCLHGVELNALFAVATRKLLSEFSSSQLPEITDNQIKHRFADLPQHLHAFIAADRPYLYAQISEYRSDIPNAGSASEGSVGGVASTSTRASLLRSAYKTGQRVSAFATRVKSAWPSTLGSK